MAPDQAFAAQMWLWPDAIVKRDANGAILFVNAAFLALYGGRVEDWHGMGLSGWASPPPANTSQRFETRSAMVDGERIYDWIESAGADGSALAMARDISGLLTPPGGEPHPADHTDSLAPHIAAAANVAAAHSGSHFETVMETHEASLQEATAQQLPPPPAAPTEKPALESAPVADVAPASIPAAEAPAPAAVPAFDLDVSGSEHGADLDAPGFETPPPAQIHAPEAPIADPGPPTAPRTVAETPREFERRALPVEDTSAVLGNNWRDAVIAKAVGAGEDTVQAPEEEIPTPAQVAAGEGGDLRILLAEDNAINALLTRTLLEAEGCVVDTVEDGALAVEAIRAKRYDLIFMDMRMPNMDGLDATRKIRSMDHASKGLPIIALTANAFDDDRNACFDAGMNDFMTKPVSAEELSEMVTRWTSEAEALKATA